MSKQEGKMLRTVDKVNGVEIQKVTTPTGKCLGFQAVRTAGDASGVERFPNLTAARKALGGHTVKTVKLTTPKSECPQNQKGYRADNQKAKR
jgi:hypothetical protein